MNFLARSILFITIGISLFLGGMSTSFATTPPPPFQITFPPGERQIADTSAVVNAYLTSTASGSVSVLVRFGTAPGTMTNEIVAYTNPNILANATYQFALSFSTLLPGTTYYFYATDTVHAISYPVQQFTTTGTAPTLNTIPPSSANLSGTTFITLPSAEQVITETSVTLVGHLVALTSGPVNLGIAYGTSPSLMLSTGLVFNSSLMESGSQDTFTYVMSGLSPGTGYYFQIRDLLRNTDSPLLYVQTKGGIGSGPGAQYGAYVLTDGTDTPPTGTPLVVEDPFENKGLVPCATSAHPAQCTFQDFLTLIGNIIDYTLILLVPATAAVCVYAGVSFIVSKGDPTKLKAAKDRLVRVLIAAAIIMLSWAVVAGIYKALIPADMLDQYTLLDVFGG